MVKVVLVDFDGVIVDRDVLDVVAGIAGKRKESAAINDQFHAGLKNGVDAITERIDLLRGVSLDQINNKLRENEYLRTGVRELFAFLNHRSITSIVSSGNIIPVLEYYQQMLGITYVVGTHPKIHHGRILGVSRADFQHADFKLHGVLKILRQFSITPSEILAIGDSPADRTIFGLAACTIAVDPKGGIERFANYVIEDDLSEAIPIINRIDGIRT